MELEENMYVRTNIGIAKVHSIKDNKVLLIKTRNNRVGRYFTVLKEPSHNIIDLIEVGDYVNGYYVTSGSKSDGCSLGSIYIAEIDGLGLHKKIYEKDIKSVVTKEQFSQMEYKVGE